jgi:hypothetical protein
VIFPDRGEKYLSTKLFKEWRNIFYSPYDEVS